MHTVSLRKVGGSKMLAVPSAFLDQLDMKVGSTVTMAVDQGKIVIEPEKKQRRYTLDQLLTNYTPIEFTTEEQA